MNQGKLNYINDYPETIHNRMINKRYIRWTKYKKTQKRIEEILIS